MKQLFIFFICVLTCSTILSAESDSLYKLQHKQIERLEQSLQSIKSANEGMKRDMKVQAVNINEQNKALDSLQSIVKLNVHNIKRNADQLGIKIDDTNLCLREKASVNDLQSKTLWGISLFVLLVIISIAIYYLLHKRINIGNANVNALKQKADKLNEDILNQLSLEMVEMQKISISLAALSIAQLSQVNSAAPDHSLIKTLADRITFMEMTLYKMDKNVRGYKQLSRSIAQMKDNLKANGYELVDMLGKPYHEGMKVTANFMEDEDLKEGEQIITNIIKPQINYNGVMIQSAQIAVSQNI